MTQFLIRTNVEDEGWTTDGVFGPDEARDQIAAILASKAIAEHEGHHFEYRVYVLDEKTPLPKPTVSWSPNGTADRVFYCEGTKVLTVPLPKPLDY